MSHAMLSRDWLPTSQAILKTELEKNNLEKKIFFLELYLPFETIHIMFKILYRQK